MGEAAILVCSPLGILHKAITFHCPFGKVQFKILFFTNEVTTWVELGSNRTDLSFSTSVFSTNLATMTACSRVGTFDLFSTAGSEIDIFFPPSTLTSVNSNERKPSSGFKKEPPGGQPLPWVTSTIMLRLRADSITTFKLL
ncbi:hypothetical protein D3C86_1567350 [compost metagenome]